MSLSSHQPFQRDLDCCGRVVDLLYSGFQIIGRHLKLLKRVSACVNLVERSAAAVLPSAFCKCATEHRGNRQHYCSAHSCSYTSSVRETPFTFSRSRIRGDKF